MKNILSSSKVCLHSLNLHKKKIMIYIYQISCTPSPFLIALVIGYRAIGNFKPCNSCNVAEKCWTHQTFPMVRPKFLTGDFTNLCRIYKAHQTNAKWTLKVFHLHCWWSRFLVKMSSVQCQWTLLIISKQWLVCCGVLWCQIGCIGLDLFNDHPCPSGHISYLQIWASEGIFLFNVSLVKLFTLVYRYTLLFSNQLVKINGFVYLKSSWLCCAICFVVVFFQLFEIAALPFESDKEKKN